MAFAKLLRAVGTATWVAVGLLDFALCAFIVWARTGMDLITMLIFAPWLLIYAPFYELFIYGNWRPLALIVALSVAGALVGLACDWLADRFVERR